jgi:beta-glucosidase
VKELKGFRKVMIRKGETMTLTFSLSQKDFSFYRQDMSFGTEAGDFDIFVGPASDTQNKVRVTLQ